MINVCNMVVEMEAEKCRKLFVAIVAALALSHANDAPRKLAQFSLAPRLRHTLELGQPCSTFIRKRHGNHISFFCAVLFVNRSVESQSQSSLFLLSDGCSPSHDQASDKFT